MKLTIPSIIPLVYIQDENIWATLEEIEFYSYVDQENYIIPKGFKTDLATSPWFGRWIVPKYGKYLPGIIVHDYLVKMQSFQDSGWTWWLANEEAKEWHEKTHEHYGGWKLDLQNWFINAGNDVKTSDYWDKYYTITAEEKHKHIHHE